MIISFKSVLHSTKSTLRQTAESGRSLTLHSTFQLLLRNENIFIAGRSSWGVCASECEGVSLHEECVCVCACVCLCKRCVLKKGVKERDCFFGL